MRLALAAAMLLPFVFAEVAPLRGQTPPTGAYDPLAIDQTANASAPLDLTIKDEARSREIPIRVYLPAKTDPAPVVLFSHGLGGSREGSSFLGKHWSARGYVAVFLQHPGSDAEVWRDAPLAERRKALQAAAGGENFLLRVKDVPAALDGLKAFNETEGHALAGRLDLERVGMSGHSFGAVTTQAVSGQSAGPAGARWQDPRIDAAVIFSPSSPRMGSPERAFARVDMPWLLMTGTQDVAAIGDIDVESRLAVYPALPAGEKYELLLKDAEHSAFGDRSLPGESGKRNPNHHRAILALSTAFWDAFLREDSAAREWLDGEGAKGVLESQDRWQRK